MVIQIIQTIFDGVWGLFGVEYPGLGISFAAIAIGSLLIVLGLRLVFMALGISWTDSRGGNNKDIKISKERRNDEK